MVKIVAISDTHCQLNQIIIPEGDILVHTGDLTYDGSIRQTSKELFELSKYRGIFKYIVLVEGNHDWLGQRNPTLMDQLCKDNGIILLRDSGITLEGLNFYGSPYQPEFCNWAWNLDRASNELKEKWDLIPDDTQVLLTHSPPLGILDGVVRFTRNSEFETEHVGCYDLSKRIKELKQLRLSVFGHIHQGYGKLQVDDVTYVNASICTEQYKPTNAPIVVEI